MKPVYIINGFLDSGKTDFFRYTIAQPYFRTKGKTLLIVCEDGENDYEEKLLKSTNTVLELIEDEEDFNPDALMALDKKYNPERILIEYNGMWNYKNMKLPILENGSKLPPFESFESQMGATGAFGKNESDGFFLKSFGLTAGQLR